MKSRNVLILIISLACLLAVGVGFAALTRNLNVSGTITVTPNFDVRFIEGTGYSVSTTVKEDDTATIAEVSLEKNKIKQIDLNIQNNSNDYIAKIYLDAVLAELTSPTGANPDDVLIGFGSTYEKYEGDRTYIVIDPGATSKITAVLWLKRAQLEVEIFNFSVKLEAIALLAE